MTKRNENVRDGSVDGFIKISNLVILNNS